MPRPGPEKARKATGVRHRGWAMVELCEVQGFLVGWQYVRHPLYERSAALRFPGQQELLKPVIAVEVNDSKQSLNK